MKIKTAYRCYECDEIQDRAPHGRCEACGSENIVPVDQGEKRKRRVMRAPRTNRYESERTR